MKCNSDVSVSAVSSQVMTISYFPLKIIVLNISVQPCAASILELSVHQEGLLGRISALMSSLSELKSRLALMNDPQVLQTCTPFLNEKLGFELLLVLSLLPSIQNGAGLTVLQSQQQSLLDRIKQLNDEIKTISSALGSNNNNHSKPQSKEKEQTILTGVILIAVVVGLKCFLRLSPSLLGV